jgi:RHS repeat-associated protein
VNNYGYDGEGRLIRDDAEEIASTKWTVTGKVKEVNRTSGSTKKNLKFRYDAMGQRIAKEVYDSQNNWEKTTYYVRDPQGNVMTIYVKTIDQQTQNLSYKIAERNIYGSSMIGLVKSEMELIGASAPATTSFIHSVGKKQYYLGNHLSNNLSVVTDVSVGYDWGNDNIVDFYRAEIISAMDYTAFGFSQDGRTFNSTEARHGFNGKEKDDEMNVEGGSYDFGARMYDSRLGRWLSVDPLYTVLPGHSPFSSMGNNPVLYIDPDGLVIIIYDDKGNKVATYSRTGVVVEPGMENSKFMTDFNSAKSYVSNGTDSYNNLINSEAVYGVHHMDAAPPAIKAGGDQFIPNQKQTTDPNTKTTKTEFLPGGEIYWDPNAALQTNSSGGANSPAINLLHEVVHADHYDSDKNAFVANVNGSPLTNPEFDTREEEITINEVNAIITKLGLTSEDKGRKNHRGSTFPVGKVTSAGKAKNPFEKSIPKDGVDSQTPATIKRKDNVAKDQIYGRGN